MPKRFLKAAPACSYSAWKTAGIFSVAGLSPATEK
jgi:hypothetical protein